MHLRPSYLHLCKANPGHWSPQALHGWPLSIRPSPVNFKTKRQHKHVHHQGFLQSPTCILGGEACPSHPASEIGLNCSLMLGTWEQILAPGEGRVVPGGLSIEHRHRIIKKWLGWGFVSPRHLGHRFLRNKSKTFRFPGVAGTTWWLPWTKLRLLGRG